MTAYERLRRIAEQRDRLLADADTPAYWFGIRVSPLDLIENCRYGDPWRWRERLRRGEGEPGRLDPGQDDPA